MRLKRKRDKRKLLESCVGSERDCCKTRRWWSRLEKREIYRDFCRRILFLEANNFSKFQRRGVKIWRRMKWPKLKGSLEDLRQFVKQHFVPVVTPSYSLCIPQRPCKYFWGRKNRIERDIHFLMCASRPTESIRQILLLACLGGSERLKSI